MLRAGGSVQPLRQSDCDSHTQYWKSYWSNCIEGIDPKLLTNLTNQQIKQVYADKCCSQMSCNGKERWLQENNLNPCNIVEPPTYPHFGNILGGRSAQENNRLLKLQNNLRFGVL